MPPPRVAIVHDWSDKRGGTERVLHELIECFPDADLFAIVDMLPEADRGRIIGDRAVPTSFIQKLAGARKHFRRYLPLMPLAIRCSRLMKYKRIDLLVDASLAKPKSELIVVGEGPNLPALKRRAGDAPIYISSVARPLRKSGNFSGTRMPFSSPPTRTSGSPRSRPRQAAHQ